MTGRQMYERWCDAQLRVPDWWQLPEGHRDAWNELAAHLNQSEAA